MDSCRVDNARTGLLSLAWHVDPAELYELACWVRGAHLGVVLDMV